MCMDVYCITRCEKNKQMYDMKDNKGLSLFILPLRTSNCEPKMTICLQEKSFLQRPQWQKDVNLQMGFFLFSL